MQVPVQPGGRPSAGLPPSHVSVDAGPNFLLMWESPRAGGRWWRAGAGSLAIHVALVGTLALMGDKLTRIPGAAHEAFQHRVVPLIAPPAQLTQRAPNRGPLSKDFTVESIAPRPESLRSPSAGAAAPSGRTARKFSLPSPRPPAPAAAIPELPNVETAQTRSPAAPPLLGNSPLPPPPQIQTEEKPKLAFENPGAQTGAKSGRSLQVPAPRTGVNEAIGGAARSMRGGIIVGDDADIGGGLPGGPRQPAAPGRLGSSLELLSDPMGADFWPYLIKVLSAVRRNWYAIIPESARLGRQGRVAVQFAIGRDGSVEKVVFAAQSGTEALDRAAVAGISASNPFPPLPADFRGNQIRLQLTFLYNVRK
ncbi:MAG: TonB family protein [Acidobacteria bacterium]|nr:TonB family protein [Acidobacteriota bacterium]